MAKQNRKITEEQRANKRIRSRQKRYRKTVY